MPNRAARAWLAGGILFSVSLEARAQDSHTWATTADFNKGTLTSLVAAGDQIQINAGINGSPFLWVSDGARSVVKVQAATGKEVARFNTHWDGAVPTNIPSPNDNSPDSTAVDASGDAFVATHGAGALGSVTKFFGNSAACVDRNGVAGIQTSSDVNGDGLIDTDCNNNGIWDTLADVQGKACSNGLKQEYFGQDDECIAWTHNTLVAVNDHGAGLAVDHNGDVWVGARSTGKLVKLRGSDGLRIQTLDAALEKGGATGLFGIAIDKNGFPVSGLGTGAPASGTWIGTWDTGTTRNASSNHFVSAEWTATLHGGTIFVEAQASDSFPLPGNLPWVAVQSGQNYPVGSQASFTGRYVQLRVTLTSAGANMPSPLLSHLTANVVSAPAAFCQAPNQTLGTEFFPMDTTNPAQGVGTNTYAASSGSRGGVNYSSPGGGSGKAPNAVCNPNLTCPIGNNMMTGAFDLQCSSLGGTSFQPPAPVTSGNCGDKILGYKAVPDGNFLPLGISTMVYTVQDNTGLTSTCPITINVLDTTAPTLNCPQPVVMECTGNNSASYTPSAPTVLDSCTLTNWSSAPSGAGTYPVGSTNVVYTGSDNKGNSATCTNTVTITDKFAPTAMQTQVVNFPIDNNLHLISLTDAQNFNAGNCGILINDSCVGPETLASAHATITCVSSTEANDMAGSILNLTATSVNLRASTAGGGRMYKIQFTVQDFSGNIGTGTCKVTASPNGVGDNGLTPYKLCIAPQMCGAGTADCDGNAGNGCEVATASDVNNCSTCGNVCPIPAHATAASCVTSACKFTCAAGFGDCDGAGGNGCEINIAGTDVNNCGSCAHVCMGGQTCVAGVCTGGGVGLNCVDIINKGLSVGNGLYMIDPDGAGALPAVQVYCDMVAGGHTIYQVHHNWGEWGANMTIVMRDVTNATLATQLEWTNTCALFGKANYSGSWHNDGETYSNMGFAVYNDAKDWWNNYALKVFPSATYNQFVILQDSLSPTCWAWNAEVGGLQCFGGPVGGGYAFCRGGNTAPERYHIFLCLP